MKRVVLCLLLSLLICLPGLARSSSTAYTWEQYKAKMSGQPLVPTEAQKSVKRATYQNIVNIMASTSDNNEDSETYLWSTSISQFFVIACRQLISAWGWAVAHYKIVLIGALVFVCFASFPKLARKRRAWKQEETEWRLKEAERLARIEEESQRKHDLHVRLTKPSYELGKLPIVDGDQPVYITLSGVKYHKEHCGVVKDYSYSKFKIGLSVALHHGYAPCSRCCAGMPLPEINRGPAPAENPQDAVLSVVEPMIEHFFDTYLQYIRSYHASLVKERNDYIASLSPEELEHYRSLRISYRSAHDLPCDEELLSLPPLSHLSGAKYRDSLLPMAIEQYRLAANHHLRELVEDRNSQHDLGT